MIGFSPTDRHPARSRSGMAIRKSTLALILIAIYLVGAHLRLSLVSGGQTIVPMYLMLMSAALMTLMYQGVMLRRAVAPLFAIMIFALVQPMLATAPGASATDQLPRILSFIVAVISGVAALVAMTEVPPEKLRRLLIGLWLVLVGLVLLESMGLKPVFDSIKTALYAGSGRGLYEATARDLALYGVTRATAFASEPSHLADSLSALTFMAYILHPRRGSLGSILTVVAMFLVGYLVSPSFKTSFYILALLIWAFWPRSLRGIVALIALILMVSTLFAIFSREVLVFFNNVAGVHMASGSFFGRMLAGPLAAHDILGTYPMLGVGLGNFDGALPAIVQIWNDSGALVLFPWYAPLGAADLMSSGFWWQWFFLGLFGGAVFSVLILWLLRDLGVEAPLRSLICTWIIWYPGAGFVDARSWFILAFVSLSVAGTASGRKRARAQDPTPHPFG